MKTILKKLHIVSGSTDDADPQKADSSPCNKGSVLRSSPSSLSNTDAKPFSGFVGWLSSVGRQNSNASSGLGGFMGGGRVRRDVGETEGTASVSGGSVASDASVRMDAELAVLRDSAIDEEYQIQLALAISAKEDPEAVQIEAVKQISLGSCLQNTHVEVLAYRYWNYNALGYDDQILDGFYDLYGIVAEPNTEKMPSLVDLQATPLSEKVNWEVVVVNRAADTELLKLDERALRLAIESRSAGLPLVGTELVQKLAQMVTNYMGGPVAGPDTMLQAWGALRDDLQVASGNIVLPLGSLTVGLARHRALLFKVLADSIGIACQLVKGRQFTLSDDGAMNIVKVDDGREYIIDLMGAPGTLIPADAIGTPTEEVDFLHVKNHDHVDSREHSETIFGVRNDLPNPIKFISSENEVDQSGCLSESTGEILSSQSTEEDPREIAHNTSDSSQPVANVADSFKVGKVSLRPSFYKPSHQHMHARSPSWTEGVTYPAVRKMKVKDVSQYMIDATKENPQLAQKLHDVLLESGVVAPANLFTEISRKQLEASMKETQKQVDPCNGKKADLLKMTPLDNYSRDTISNLAVQGISKINCTPHEGRLKHLESVGETSSGETRTASHSSQQSGALVLSPIHVPAMPQLKPKTARVPVAAAAATAAVVASSMVVAAAKANIDSNIDVPVAAAATATAAAVVATTAAVSRQYEQLDMLSRLSGGAVHTTETDMVVISKSDGSEKKMGENVYVQETELPFNEQDANYHEADRNSDRSTGNESGKSDATLDDVAEWEILWEEITLGERIGLGSYGEVYRGEWHGTEVAVKKFIEQDISGDALEEFRTEVRIMKRLRHPNVVLFMGAVMRAPNLSIVTEFLPRGSLYRLIHRPNSQIDERRRLRMALDVARGMNYLHNSSPVIVHRDLKSPNLLVDKNWVVKVCDFGLSRLKHQTFLSSRSTAGTAEWMAPEVLRNEPSDEKCDVYSFGVILWELATLRQPWAGMNPMQVVGAVGFQHRRLDIPHDVDPAIAEIIIKCWETEPKWRPSFAEIMASLKPLQKPIRSPTTNG